MDVEPLTADLVVEAPTVSDSSPATGQAFTLSATVRNAGDGESAATTLRVYRSTDQAITTADTAEGTDQVAGLAAAESTRASVPLTAPADPGTYYYGACVDAVADESDITNNCSASVPVTVPAPVPALRCSGNCSSRWVWGPLGRGACLGASRPRGAAGSAPLLSSWSPAPPCSAAPARHARRRRSGRPP